MRLYLASPGAGGQAEGYFGTREAAMGLFVTPASAPGVPGAITVAGKGRFLGHQQQ